MLKMDAINLVMLSNRGSCRSALGAPPVCRLRIYGTAVSLSELLPGWRSAEQSGAERSTLVSKTAAETNLQCHVSQGLSPICVHQAGPAAGHHHLPCTSVAGVMHEAGQRAANGARVMFTSW